MQQKCIGTYLRRKVKLRLRYSRSLPQLVQHLINFNWKLKTFSASLLQNEGLDREPSDDAESASTNSKQLPMVLSSEDCLRSKVMKGFQNAPFFLAVSTNLPLTGVNETSPVRKPIRNVLVFPPGSGAMLLLIWERHQKLLDHQRQPNYSFVFQKFRSKRIIHHKKSVITANHTSHFMA